MNHSYKILKYLFQHNDGEYHSMFDIYKGKNKPSNQFLLDKTHELSKQDYLEIREDAELVWKDTPTGKATQGAIRYHSLKIKPKGEEFIEVYSYNIFGWIFKRNNFASIIVPIILSAVVSTGVTILVNLILR